jgi:hypothetical protein
MENIDFFAIFYIMGIFIVPGVYLFQFHKLVLIKKGRFAKQAFILFVVVAFSGLINMSCGNFNSKSIALAISLLSPIYHLYFFRFIFSLFINKIGREPIDVAFNFKSGLFIDRFFAIGFFLFAIYSSFAVSGIFLWGKGLK